MKTHVLIISIGGLALAAAAFAGDAWKDKQYETWDQKDVTKILFDSPWSQKIELGGPGGTPTGGGGRGGPNAAGGGNGDGATNGGGASASGGRTVGGSEQPNYPRTDKDITGSDTDSGRAMSGQQDFLARWVSSRTVREAFLRSAELDGKPTDEQQKAVAAAPGSYQVLILARDLRAFQTAGADALKQTIYLETKKSHERIVPAKITLGTDPGGSHVIYVLAEFPKTTDKGDPTIAKDEKGVDFMAEAGKLKLKFHFDVSKMADREGVDL